MSEEKEDLTVVQHEDSFIADTSVNILDHANMPTSLPSITSFIPPSGFDDMDVR